MIHQADGDNKYHSFLYCVFISSVIQIAMNGLNSIGLIVFSMLGETIAANPVSQQVATIHNKFVLDMTLLNLLLDKFLKNCNVLSKCIYVIIFVYKMLTPQICIFMGQLDVFKLTFSQFAIDFPQL